MVEILFILFLTHCALKTRWGKSVKKKGSDLGGGGKSGKAGGTGKRGGRH